MVSERNGFQSFDQVDSRSMTCCSGVGGASGKSIGSMALAAIVAA
ncbi:MAG: hypothetical protein QM765_06595 [Myxococcales bacterium]